MNHILYQDGILKALPWTVSLKLRRIDWNLAGVGLACSAVRAPGQGADQVAGDAPAQGGDRPGAMAGRADRGAGFRGVGVRGAEGEKASLANEEAVGRQAQGDVVVQAAPGASL